jgi:hypothetical protein
MDPRTAATATRVYQEAMKAALHMDSP